MKQLDIDFWTLRVMGNKPMKAKHLLLIKQLWRKEAREKLVLLKE